MPRSIWKPQEEAPDHSANVVNLAELLKASLASRRGGPGRAQARAPAKKRA